MNQITTERIENNILSIEGSIICINTHLRAIKDKVQLTKGLLSTLQGNTNIKKVGLSARALRILHTGLEINTLEELQQFKHHELLKYRNCGRKTYDEILWVMNKHNLRFIK